MKLIISIIMVVIITGCSITTIQSTQFTQAVKTQEIMLFNK